MESPATVPPEIVELIIDKVALFKDDRERSTALKACSLICRNFKNVSQRHLFQSLTIDFITTKCDNRTPALIQNSAIFSSSNLPLYVQELHLLDLWNIQLSCEQILAEILSMLKEVKILHIDFDDPGSLKRLSWIMCEWSKFTHILRQALTTMIFSLPLSNLMLEHVKELPLLIIPRFRFIPTVHLNIVEFPAQEIVQIEPLIEGPSPDIKSLTLVLLDRWSVKSITDTLSTRLGKLKKLTMDLSTCISDDRKDLDFLKHCNSLTTLELLTKSMLLYYPKKIDLSMLPHLRSIKLATDFALRGEPSCILYNLGQCLRTASANNEIKEIVLGPSCDLYHVIMKPGPDQWKELDMLLSGP